jgi:hypothetical protein
MAWLCWEIPIRLGVSVHSPLFQLAALPGGFAPAIAAIVVRKWITREGFADAGLRIDLSKWPYYIVACLLPLVSGWVHCRPGSAVWNRQTGFFPCSRT